MGLGQNSVSRVCVSVQFAPRRLRRWDRGWPATIDRFVRSTCACLECSIENCSQNFGFGGKEENTHRGEGNYSLFYLFTIIFVKDSSFKWKIALRIGPNLKWKGYWHGSGDKERRSCLLVSSSFLKEKKGGEKKVSRASLWVQSRATITHFLYLLHLSVSQVSQLWLLINHEISIYNLW